VARVGDHKGQCVGRTKQIARARITKKNLGRLCAARTLKKAKHVEKTKKQKEELPAAIAKLTKMRKVYGTLVPITFNWGKNVKGRRGGNREGAKGNPEVRVGKELHVAIGLEARGGVC